MCCRYAGGHGGRQSCDAVPAPPHANALTACPPHLLPPGTHQRHGDQGDGGGAGGEEEEQLLLKRVSGAQPWRQGCGALPPTPLYLLPRPVLFLPLPPLLVSQHTYSLTAAAARLCLCRLLRLTVTRTSQQHW